MYSFKISEILLVFDNLYELEIEKSLGIFLDENVFGTDSFTF